MDLRDYFENTQGTGILATADSEGKVDLAIYARPHFMDDNTVAFIMRDRLSHKNLQSNPQAAYMFIEISPGYQGKRLYLQKVREEKNSDLIKKIQRKTKNENVASTAEDRFLVYFRIDRIRPLVGDKLEEA